MAAGGVVLDGIARCPGRGVRKCTAQGQHQRPGEDCVCGGDVKVEESQKGVASRSQGRSKTLVHHAQCFQEARKMSLGFCHME